MSVVIVSGVEVVSGGPEAAHAQLRVLLRKLPELATELGERHGDTVETLGLRGSIQKRMAQMLFHAAQNEQLDHSRAAYLQDSIETLRRARSYCYEALRGDLWRHWVVVQYLSLTPCWSPTKRSTPATAVPSGTSSGRSATWPPNTIAR